MKDELPKNIKFAPPWQPPLRISAHPDCDLCSWSYRPALTGDAEKPWCVKWVNVNCWKHRRVVLDDAVAAQEPFLEMF